MISQKVLLGIIETEGCEAGALARLEDQRRHEVWEANRAVYRGLFPDDKDLEHFEEWLFTPRV